MLDRIESNWKGPLCCINVTKHLVEVITTRWNQVTVHNIRPDGKKTKSRKQRSVRCFVLTSFKLTQTEQATSSVPTAKGEEWVGVDWMRDESDFIEYNGDSTY